MEVKKSVKSENNVKLEVKQEKELLIENDFNWGVANAYYQEFGLSDQQEGENHHIVQIKDEPLEMFHENDYDGGYEYDEYIEDDHMDNYEEDSSNEEENFDDENNFAADIEENANSEPNASCSNKLNYLSLKEFITKNFMGRACNFCDNIAVNSYEWRKHLEAEHVECIAEAEQNYEINGKIGVCKKCKQSVEKGYLQVLHNLEHLNIGVIVCKICKYTSITPSFVKKHIVEAHEEVVEEFKNTEYQGKSFKCPKCSFIYRKFCQLAYHIKDEHPENFVEKYTYTCHMCLQHPFVEIDSYLHHLKNNHKLNSWQTLNYKRLSENKELFACLKCFMIFVENDTNALLKHYLTHITDCRWNCGICLKKLTLSKKSLGHMCKRMIELLKARIKKGNILKEPIKGKLDNFQEFEEYVYHVCSFCNEIFSKTQKWQEHLQNVHKIDTLETLKMKAVPGEVNRLCCIICHTMVVNTPVQLHAHCFQHLPYKPYKCIHCSQSLSTYKMALNHVINRCKTINSGIKTEENNKKSYGIRGSILIKCPFCNHQQYNNDKELYKHIQEEHNNFEEYFLKQPDNSMSCNVCAKSFLQYDKNICLRHFHNHLNEKAFKCVYCEKSYTTLKFCYKHLLYLHYVTPINENKSSLTHQITEMSNALLSSSVEEDVTKSTKFKLARYNCKSSTLNEFNEYITYACPECNESMPSHKTWHDHIITQHNFFQESNLVVKDSDGNVKCPTCNMKLAINMSSQQKHKLTHMPYRSFICKLCYNRCNSLGVLYGHLRRHHFSPGSFKCPVCSDILKTAYDRTEHLKSKHPIYEWPSTLCLICYKNLGHKSSLAKHMTVHDADREKFTCNVCGAKLLGKRDFQAHVERHNKGEKRKLEYSDIANEQKSSKSMKTNI